MRLPASRAGLFWLTLPIMIIMGAGGGYLAANAGAPATVPAPSATAPSDHAHGGADGHSDEHGTTAGDHAGHAVDSASDPHAAGPDHADAAGGHADHGDVAGGHGDSGGEHAGAAATDRVGSSTRMLVLAVFAAVNAGILIAAAALRRRGGDHRRWRESRQLPSIAQT